MNGIYICSTSKLNVDRGDTVQSMVFTHVVVNIENRKQHLYFATLVSCRQLTFFLAGGNACLTHKAKGLFADGSATLGARAPTVIVLS